MTCENGSVDGWITLQEMATRLGLKDTSPLLKAIKAGTLRAQRFGGKVWAVSEEEYFIYVEGGREREGKGRPRKLPSK